MTDEHKPTGADDQDLFSDSARENMIAYCVEHGDLEEAILHDLDDVALKDHYDAVEAGVELEVEEQKAAEEAPILITPKGDPVSSSGMNVANMRTVIKGIEGVGALDALEDQEVAGPSRKSVLDAISKRRSELADGPGAQTVKELPNWPGHEICVYTGPMNKFGKAPNRIIDNPEQASAFIDCVFEIREQVNEMYPVCIVRDWREMAQLLFEIVIPETERPRDRKPFVIHRKDYKMMVVKPGKDFYDQMKKWMLERGKEDHKELEDMAELGFLTE